MRQFPGLSGDSGGEAEGPKWGFGTSCGALGVPKRAGACYSPGLCPGDPVAGLCLCDSIGFGQRGRWEPTNTAGLPRDETRGRIHVAGTCELCGKTTTFGHNVSFSKRRTNRKFKANVHRKTLTINGVTIRTNVCTQCMRTVAKTK